MKRHLFASALLSLLATLAACAGEIGPGTDDSSATPSSFDLGQSDLRIAVIGAGASGLTAAYTLSKLGYQNVTVYEKEDHVGGKISSFKVGDISAELGAVFASPDYKTVLGLADELGVQYVPYASKTLIMDEHKVRRTFQEFLTSRYTLEEIQTAIQNYAKVLHDFAQIDQDGFADLPDDLDLPFDQFAANHGFVPVAELAKSLIVGFGYGYYDTVPAAYVMKLLPWLVKLGPNGLESPPYFVFPNGYQNLWVELSHRLDVRLNSNVTNIERSPNGGPVKLSINGADPVEYDAVIVSAALNTVPKFIKLTDTEKALFAKVQTSRYFVTLFSALNVPLGETVFLHGNGDADKINHPSVWGNPGGNLPVFITYQLADKHIWPFLLNGILAFDLLKLTKGVFLFQAQQKEWEYFPRVDTAALAANFYEQIDSLQGQGGLYYVGSALSFETVEHTSRFAKTLVENHFPAAAIVAPGN